MVAFCTLQKLITSQWYIWQGINYDIFSIGIHRAEQPVLESENL
jgi:hypothetical protein